MAVVRNLMVRSGADFSALYKEMQTAQKRMNAFKKGITKTMKTISIALGGLAVGKLIKDSLNAASELEGAFVGLESILTGQGRSFSKAKAFINDYIQDGLIPLTDAITAYKNLAARGYNDEQIQQVLERLKDAAAFGRQSSYTLGEAVLTATEGLKNENSILVDNAGVTKFQSTPLREGRLMQQLSWGLTPGFQSTPLREGRRCRPLCVGFEA